MFAPLTAKTKPAARTTNKRAPQRSTIGAQQAGHGSVEDALLLQRAIGNQATLRLPESSSRLAAPRLPAGVQAKLIVGPVDDPLERAADRTADQVMRMPDPAPAGLHSDAGILQRQCESCRQDEEKLTRKAADSTSAQGGMPAPDIVHETISSAGVPLDTATRAFFEPRFRHDFSQVRVHADSRASDSAKALGALGYTVGDHIVLANGQAGKRALLAHELAHVVQQSGAQPVLRRFAPCRYLLDAPERTSVAEKDVQQSVAAQAAGLGTVERELGIPAGSARPQRTEPARGSGKGDVIEPQTIDEKILGKVDVAVLTGTALELIEVKRATWPDAIFAEAQMLNYVHKGEDAMHDVERLWRNRGHPGDTISSIEPMSMSRLVPETPERIGGAAVSLAWCSDGVLSFKAIGDKDQDVFVCGANDQGRIDSFLNRALDPAQAAAERFIAREIEAPAIKALQAMSLRAMLQRLVNIPQFRRLLPLSGVLGAESPILDLALKKLQPFEVDIRAIAESFLHRVMTDLRQQVQAQLRNTLQQTMAALCAKTAEMTLRELLDAFDKQMRRDTIALIPVVAEAAAMQLLKEGLIEAGEALVTVVAVVIGLLLAWEVAVALAAIEGIGSLIVGIGAVIARLLAQLAPIFD